jgi:pyridoxamine 5'-phosphate oxidase
MSGKILVTKLQARYYSVTTNKVDDRVTGWLPNEVSGKRKTQPAFEPAYTASMTSLADLRKSYERAELSEEASHANPLLQFEKWLQEAIAAEVPEPNAMTLATVASNLRPSTRVVLIKGYDQRGITWFTNYASRKGQELAGNPFAALQFHWVELERVVRIEGRVERVSAQESDEYFHSRPLDSRIGAWASPQSQVIGGRSVLLTNAASYAAKFLLQPPRPPHWGGYRLQADSWQFWQGRKSRLHDRLRYSLINPDEPTAATGPVWLRERLAP